MKDTDIQAIKEGQAECISKEGRADLCVSVLKDFSDESLSDGVLWEMVEHYKKLLWRVNKVTSAHRHGAEVTDRALTELSNYQLECESILAKLEGNDG